MRKINSKIELYEDDFEKIVISSDEIIEKLEKNKLKKYDRDLLISAVAILFEIRQNED